MFSQNSSDNHGNHQQREEIASQVDAQLDLQRELNQLQQIIADGVHLPMTRLVLLNEKKLLKQLAKIKANLPTALTAALEVLTHQQIILQQASERAQNLVETAQAQRYQILNESAIIRKAELEAAKLRFQTQKECEQLKQQALQEIEQWHQLTIAECQQLQAGADDYADGVLSSLEEQLHQMLTIIYQGRQQLKNPDSDSEQ